MSVELHFDHGTLVVPHVPADAAFPRELFVFDERTRTHRAPAHRYRDVVRALVRGGVPHEDRARGFEVLALELVRPFAPFPHQKDALEAWQRAGSRGIVVLPTGAGKTLLGVLAILHVARSTLIVTPTIDLMVQWQRVLAESFGVGIGMLGGGLSERLPITVTTYDSAAFQTEFHGNQFGLLIADECHHLPASAYRFIAEGSIAPFRLGLTATLERADGGERVAKELLGPVVHDVEIRELEGQYLAPYEVHSIPVELAADELAEYEQHRARYLDFLRGERIRLSDPRGWAEFVTRAHRSDAGKEAYRSYRAQKRIALGSRRKFEVLWELLVRHRRDRVLVFTDDNETVYRLSHTFFVPALTHQTKATERKDLLDAFSSGEISALLTSRVLNEGVDVPDANVGIVLSGSGSVREHVQRLGRILRKRPDKRARMYEVFADVAAEHGIRERRRQHAAYDRDE